MASQNIGSCLKALEKFMLQSYPIVSSTVVLQESTQSTRKQNTPAEMVAKILGITNLGKTSFHNSYLIIRNHLD